jgi:hypothetical protein
VPNLAVTLKPTTPLIVEQRQADLPGGGSKSATHSVATHQERGHDGDGPSGPGKAGLKRKRADPRSGITPPNENAIAERLQLSKEKYDTTQKVE